MRSRVRLNEILLNVYINVGWVNWWAPKDDDTAGDFVVAGELEIIFINVS